MTKAESRLQVKITLHKGTNLPSKTKFDEGFTKNKVKTTFCCIQQSTRTREERERERDQNRSDANVADIFIL